MRCKAATSSAQLTISADQRARASERATPSQVGANATPERNPRGGQRLSASMSSTGRSVASAVAKRNAIIVGSASPLRACLGRRPRL